ncbi:MAG TPA: DUF4097 family beta strand repeat-containing protein [Bryobacteraceae bacterium]|jgi:hypothetical protein|nr:DUF4097 family beta strand repeat-containing protein [Bryobacteraceae bacterium]
MNIHTGISRHTILLAAGALAGILGAQNLSAQDKITVPLSTPTQPATVKAHLINGSITVTAGSGPQVVVESVKSPGASTPPRRRERSTPPPGMHRLDVGGGDLDVVEDHNVVTIKSGLGGASENLEIQVPANTSVELKTVNGRGISVTGISGDIDVECTNGTVTLTNVSGAAVAHTLNGNLTASFDKITPGKPMSFTSLNGKVDVTLPADTKAKLRLKTQNGAVFSDFDVKMESDASKPVVEDGRGLGGKYRIRMDHGIYGSINGGGPEYVFQTMNGEILIHKK